MNKGFLILKWTVACILFVMLFGWVTMTLWNWLIPSLFNGPVLNFWQALGLLILSKILFSGLGGGGWKSHNSVQFKKRYYDKLANMTPEDRERFKARMTEKWCSPRKHTSTENTDISNG
jgi:hypothetical protein